MGTRVEWVEYGRGAAEALRAEIARAKAASPLAPVTVVVASNHVGVATRRLLAKGTLGPTSATGSGLIAVSFVTPYRLAELLGAPSLAAGGRRPVSTPMIAAALRAALAREPGLFAPVAEHPATETALVATYRELREVSAKGLDGIAASSPRAADVVRIHRATRTFLEPRWYDEQDLMRAAAAELAAGRATASSAELGSVILYLPQRISPHVQVLLTAIASACAEFTVLAGSTGDPRADADVLTAVRRLAPSADEPAEREPHTVVASDRTRIVLVSDADEEVRAAVRRVIEAVRAGTPLDRIAVLNAGAEPYARLTHEHLRVAGIRANGTAVMPLSGRVAGRALLDLLALPERNFRRQDVFAWLTTAPLRHQGTPAPVAAWERISRDAGIVAGREQWDTRLTRFVDELDARIATADPDQPEWRVDRDRKRARRARDLRAFVVDLIDELFRIASRPRGWGAHARWAREKLTTIVGDPGGRLRSARRPYASRRRWSGCPRSMRSKGR
jgi:ATP-dependent helicase/nuclease subunit B